MFRLSLKSFTRENLDLTSTIHASSLVENASLQVTKPLLTESIPDVLQKRRALALEAIDVALIQPTVARLASIGLAQNAAHELGERRLRSRIREHCQHIRERAIPALLQRLLRDDVADIALRRKQSPHVIRFLQLILLARLDRDHIRRHTVPLMQVLAHLFRVDVLCVALILARPLHLDQANRPDVFPCLRFVFAGLCFEEIPAFRRIQQRLFPIGRGLVVNVQIELDHSFALQRCAFHIHQHIRAFRRCGGQLQDKARIEALDRRARERAVSLLSFVEND